MHSESTMTNSDLKQKRLVLYFFLIALIITFIGAGCSTIGALNQYSDEDAIMSAANQWARAFQYRDGNIRYGLLTPELQKVFFQKDKTVVSEERLFKEKGMIIIGWSSPWVDHYEIKYLTDQNKAIITYFMTDSTKSQYKMIEELTFAVKHDKAKVINYTTSDIKPIIDNKSNSLV